MKRGGVDRDDRVAGGQQPVHDQPTGGLDRHRQRGGGGMAGEPGQGGGQVGFGVVEDPAINDPAGGVDDGDGVAGVGPVPSGNQHGVLLVCVAQV